MEIVNKQKLCNIIIKMISDSMGYDCSFISKTKELIELESFFSSFFKEQDLSFNKIDKNVYLCGKYVIKIKRKYQPEYLINDECLVNVYYKKNVIFKTKSKSLEIGIEIQDYIISDEDIKHEDVCEIYFNLRKKGYIWFDAKPNNLIKSNGKIYIIDTDYIFRENDKGISDINIMPSELSIRLNELYEEIEQ